MNPCNEPTCNNPKGEPGTFGMCEEHYRLYCDDPHNWNDCPGCGDCTPGYDEVYDQPNNGSAEY